MQTQTPMFWQNSEFLALQLTAQLTGHPCNKNKIILAAWTAKYYPKLLPQQEQIIS